MHLLIAITIAFTMSAIPPQQCEREPLELPLFDATPAVVVAESTPVTTPVEMDNPRAVMAEMIVCMTHDDPAYRWAIFTPRWLASQFTDSSEHYQPAFEQMLTSRTPPGDASVELESVGEPEQLPDGSVALEVTLISDGTVWTDRLILINIDGTWYIDDVELISPPVATPAS